jgi:hypothetical protein
LQFDVFSREEPEEAAVCIVLVTKYSGDVLPHDDDGRLAFCGADLVDGVGQQRERRSELPTVVRETLAESRDRERLARRASDKKVGSLDFAREDALRELGHISEVRHLGVMVCQDSRRERLDLREPSRGPPELVPRAGRGFDA